jgi:DNA-directed RNA polymerase subunit L
MNPQIDRINEDDNELTFTLSGVNVSFANALRRTIMSDIPCVVFKTTPHEENKSVFLANTSRLHNEILKQRLSCVPIHINDVEAYPYKNYYMELNVENLTDSILYVTSKDFIVKDIATKTPISKDENRAIFPQNDYTECFIDFVRLRPKLSDEIPGEKIHLTCDFSIGTAKEDGMFGVVSTCAYGFTVDKTEMERELGRKRSEWEREGKTKEEIDFESENWKLLDGLRVTKKDSFDFVIQTVGVFTNRDLIQKASDILVSRLGQLEMQIDENALVIKPALNTMTNCYDIILENEDYTIGKVIEFMLYAKFYETKVLTYCGFKKMHPHDHESIIRVAYAKEVDKGTIYGHLKECIVEAKQVIDKINSKFAGK